MRTVLKLVLVLALCLILVGFFRGWFTFSRQSGGPGSEKVNVNMSVNKGKIKSDVNKAEEKIKEEVKELEGEGTAKEGK